MPETDPQHDPDGATDPGGVRGSLPPGSDAGESARAADADGPGTGEPGPGASGASGAGAGTGQERPGDAARNERMRKAAGTSARAARTAASGTSRAARASANRLHRAAEAKGAGQTGLSRLIELNAASAFADALVTMALAGTLFFSVPTGEARGNVALYLALTMAPFAVVAPVIGPFLDRFGHGRRWAIGLTAAARGFLAWVAADAVIDGGVWLYPAALGVLVGQKAYAVTRAAAVPRLLPEGWTLVTANSRLQLAATFGTALGAPLGIGLAQISDDWPLRAAFFAYCGTTVLAILLSKSVDSAAGEAPTTILEDGSKGRFRVGRSVVRALRANATLRWFSGFMTLFMAFVLREEPVAGLSGLVLLGFVAAAAWLGSTAGSAVGALVRSRSPDRTVLALVGFVVVCAVVAMVFWNLLTVVLVGLAAGFGQQLGRLSLDAIVQRDVPERNRSNAFARSETLLQLGWVVGGGVGIVLPLIPWVGMLVAALVMAVGLVAALRVRPDDPAPPPPPDENDHVQ
ncbi:MFS transporter [Haloactinopolyspora alba]|uniref:MFS transporter n=1 Tax=Haloactinopolyspora alba TaxID=648780 RepID=UPI00101BD80C|nr:MFS transporter [Haloactinopolyspora alba]